MAKNELDEVRAFARDHYGQRDLEAWDIGYYSEKLRQHRYAISKEDLKPYFPEDRVIKGMFQVVGRLYGLDIRELEGVEVWHPAVRFFALPVSVVRQALRIRWLISPVTSRRRWATIRPCLPTMKY